MASNSDYSFIEVVNGTGFFSYKQDTGFSQGVAQLQTYLKKIGYSISDPNGRFQASTEQAVKDFQEEVKLLSDGVAGPKTCDRLNIVQASEYFNTYGKPISTSEWGQANILKGNFDNTDLLARIIYGENTTNIPDQCGVALVIANRVANGTDAYSVSKSQAPGASIYARVVGMASQYGSADAGFTQSQTPLRGYGGNETNGFINPGWKNAVELAKKIVKGYKIAATGYKISGTTILVNTMTVNSEDNKDYLNQVKWSQYVDWYKANYIVTSVQPLKFSRETSGNVICKYSKY